LRRLSLLAWALLGRWMSVGKSAPIWLPGSRTRSSGRRTRRCLLRSPQACRRGRLLPWELPSRRRLAVPRCSRRRHRFHLRRIPAAPASRREKRRLTSRERHLVTVVLYVRWSARSARRA